MTPRGVREGKKASLGNPNNSASPCATGKSRPSHGGPEGTKGSPENPRNPVETAYSWHGGQWSPLYSFASTGGRVHGEEHRQALVGEIRSCLRFAEERHMTDEIENLNELLACVGGKEDDSE